MSSNGRVVVVAGSLEGIDAMARLINALPSAFPAPVVAHVHGLLDESAARSMRAKLDLCSGLGIVDAHDGERVRAGCVHVAPMGWELVFTGPGTLGLVRPARRASADRLFESAALWHGNGTIGVVLSGSGDDGTRGLRSITRVDGTRVVQSPIEASFAAMPTNALIGDGVQYSVMLDQIGGLLTRLTAEPRLESLTHRDQANRSLDERVACHEQWF